MELTDNQLMELGFQLHEESVVDRWFEMSLSPAGEETTVCIIYYCMNDTLRLHVETKNGATIIPLYFDSIDELKSFIYGVYSI